MLKLAHCKCYDCGDMFFFVVLMKEMYSVDVKSSKMRIKNSMHSNREHDISNIEIQCTCKAVAKISQGFFSTHHDKTFKTPKWPLFQLVQCTSNQCCTGFCVLLGIWLSLVRTAAARVKLHLAATLWFASIFGFFSYFSVVFIIEKSLANVMATLALLSMHDASFDVCVQNVVWRGHEMRIVPSICQMPSTPIDRNFFHVRVECSDKQFPL